MDESMYPHANAKSSHSCVSAASAQESESLAQKAASYRLFCHASAIFAVTERDERLIWSVRA
ncbi:hypothetical protein OP10G_2809 [Fimbriimonas ginsengisoli Gsoil 348]|uniref:Uncharacterized protein n=1 Tax=Fimbriimonas ginsengisoli Gsoil 348 TaxID=661478 RepID=A0A068NS57_FIMGI|nr:hypothetical protein OP10G_2809 [Fimbriimonas ginsengisoli Gsoil 348]